MLDEILDDRPTLDRMSASSLRRVERRFRWNDIADAYERVLSELC